MGYARVSAPDRDPGIQVAALEAAGCGVIRAGTGSGASRMSVYRALRAPPGSRAASRTGTAVPGDGTAPLEMVTGGAVLSESIFSRTSLRSWHSDMDPDRLPETVQAVAPPMNHQQNTDRETIPDHGDFGNLPPHFSNRFHLFAGPSISRIYFGDQMLKDGETLFHTLIAMHTSDLAELRDLIDRLLESHDVSGNDVSGDCGG